MNDLDALRGVSFDWVLRLPDIWNDPEWDVPEVHAPIRQEFSRRLDALRADSGGGSPLGWVVVGGGGAGKTHLLGAFRREAARRQATFILVDMTDVRDFWETVLQGYLGSLQQPLAGGAFPYQAVIAGVVARLGSKKSAGEILSHLAQRKSTDLKADIDLVLAALSRLYRAETLQHQNIIRALIGLNSDDYGLANAALTWLQGQALDDPDRQRLGFSVAREQPRRVVEALSWLLSLGGPTVLAFDQLDPILTQLHYRRLSGDHAAEEHAAAQAIIAGIGGGLGALRDLTRRTLTVVSCIESTWDILGQTVLRTFIDRFEPPRSLAAVGRAAIARSVVVRRLAAGFAQAGFTPPYPSWPFRPEAFEELTTDSPREVLKKCERHRQKCLGQGKVEELSSFQTGAPVVVGPTSEAPEFAALDQRFAQLRDECDPDALCAEKHEDERLAPLLQAALQCLLHERELPADVGAVVETQFTGGTTTRPLHARLRLIFTHENDREEHYCVRALQRTNATAYQNRLKAALTESGIDPTLTFRHLAVIRRTPVPTGSETARLTRAFTQAGGIFLNPTDHELRTLSAVHRLRQFGAPEFLAWLQARRPVSRLALIRAVVPSPLFFGEEPAGAAVASPIGPDTNNGRSEPAPHAFDDITCSPDNNSISIPSPSSFRLGRPLHSDRGDLVSMNPISLLANHTAILAAAGSGQTELVRRLIEEAALLGVPSIVIDSTNSLSTLDERRPDRPGSWFPDDPERAARFHEQSDVVLWTPGREDGNPLTLGQTLDPALLLGGDDPSRTRISVISLVGLPAIEMRRMFLNQLALKLLGWIERHPDPAPRPLRGLLVLDEARDFVPSAPSSTCRESLARLAVQARTYHLGLIFATQNPQDIDPGIVAGCSTHFYGRVNAPAAIEAVRALIRQHGGSGDDVPRLPPGLFYVHNADVKTAGPFKVEVPPCLSRPKEDPPDPDAIVSKAAEDRARL